MQYEEDRIEKGFSMVFGAAKMLIGAAFVVVGLWVMYRIIS